MQQKCLHNLISESTLLHTYYTALIRCKWPNGEA